MSILSNTNLLNSLLEQANNLPDAGGAEPPELPDLTNPATGSQILSGYEAIDENGEVITGTITTKTSSNLTASGATVTVPAGYYATQATKNVSTAAQATPSISVNSSGLITASATQAAGYVNAGTKSATKQLTTQGAKTITPSTSEQVAVAAGVYTTGDIKVAAVSDTTSDSNTPTGMLVELPVDGWTGTTAPYEQTVAVDGILANFNIQNVIIAPYPEINYINEVTSCGVYLVAQYENSLVFNAMSIKPTINIMMNVQWQKVNNA